MKLPNFIVLISRGVGLEERSFKARDMQVISNSTIVITDVHGEAHYIPKAMWYSIVIRQPFGNVEVPQGAS